MAARSEQLTIAEAKNLIMDARRTACLVHLLIRGVEFSISYVIDNGVIEEDGRLGHDADLGS